MNDQSKFPSVELSAFDALRAKQSVKEQNAILDRVFPSGSPHNKTTQSATAPCDADNRVAQLYKDFQLGRIPHRESNIDTILSELLDTTNDVRLDSNISSLPRQMSDGVSRKMQYYATAAILVLSLTAMLQLSNSRLQTNRVDVAVSQLIQTPYTGKLSSISTTHTTLSFSSNTTPGSEAFIVGVSSIDLPVLLASQREGEAEQLIEQLERLALGKNESLIPPLITLTKNRPFDITHFQSALQRDISAKRLDERQTGFYKLGRWVESCILAAEVALNNKDYSLLNTLLKAKPATSTQFPDEINHLLKASTPVIGATDERSKARELYRQLMLIKGYF